MNAPRTAIHEAACATWEIPAESRPEALISAGYRDERVVSYLSSLRPIYDAVTRSLGQMAGLLLLIQIRGLDPHRGASIRDALREQLAELAERSRTIVVPETARQHFASIEILVGRLNVCAGRFDRQQDMVDPSSADLDAMTSSLQQVQKGLLAAAVPQAGLAPVDFKGACCTCGPAAARRAH